MSDEKCPDCKGKGGYMLYDPGLSIYTCANCHGTGVVRSYLVEPSQGTEETQCQECRGKGGSEVANEALIEEMLSDLEKVTASVEQFAYRWGKYGQALANCLTEEQSARVQSSYERFVARLELLADG